MLKPGERVDRFVIEEPLGEGGMGRVYRAYDERLDRRVAIKVLVQDEDPDARARLVREARAVAQLDHPNVVAVYDVGEVEGSPYIAMELVQGRSLRALVGDPSATPEARVRCLLEVARALAAAHDAGLVHRDVKPENVLIRSDGRVKVLDFGIARRSRPTNDPSAPTDVSLSTLTADGVKLGTPMYMAPEQIRGGKVDGRCDQFSWGVTAYEVFTGRTPWSGGDPLAVIASIMTEEPAPPPASAKMPYAFAGTVRRALAKRAEDRFPTMHLLIEAVEAALGPQAPGAPLASKPPPSGPPASGAPSASYPPPASPRRQDMPPGFSFTRRYGTQELAEIFDRALAVQKKKYEYDDVVQAAHEIGLDELSVREAMGHLVERGTVPASDTERARAVMRAKRLGAIWGVIAAFFFLLNMFDLRGGLWFQYPVVCIGLPFGFLIVLTLFPGAKKRPLLPADPALEQDARRMTQYLAARPRVRVDVPAPTSSLHAAEAEALAEAEAARTPGRARST